MKLLLFIDFMRALPITFPRSVSGLRPSLDMAHKGGYSPLLFLWFLINCYDAWRNNQSIVLTKNVMRITAKRNTFSNVFLTFLLMTFFPFFSRRILHIRERLLPPQTLRISHKGKRETRVTGDEAQGTMARTKKRGETGLTHFFLLASLCPQIFIERERRLGTKNRVHPS